MKLRLRTLAAIAIGATIVMAAAADASPRSGIDGDEAKRLRHQVQQYQKMKRHAGLDGVITRAEQARLDHKAQQLRRLLQKAKTR
jgi:orotidine-5'-phosphate decarboxylase